MTKNNTSLDDIGEAIRDLGTMVGNKINYLDISLGGRIDRLETKVDKGFTEVNGKLKSIENDVKAIYKMLADVQKDVKSLRKSDKELDRRLTNLEEFAKNLSRQTGVPFET